MDFEELYNAYADDVYKLSLSLCGDSHLAEDVTSETFLKAVKAIGEFKGDCNMRVWLCQIAKNTYYNMAKRNKFVAEMPEDLPSDNNLEQKFVNQSQALEIHHALHKIAEPYKEVFSLRVFSELPFAQIGAIFGKPDSWARVTFHRAKNMLKEGIGNE